MAQKRITLLTKITIVLLTVALFALLLKRDYFVESLQVRETQALARSRDQSFLGVYFNNERIGYVKHKYADNDQGGIDLHQEAFLVLNILGEQHQVRLTGTAQLTSAYLLQKFSFQLKAPFYSSKVQGHVEGNKVRLEIFTGKEVIRDVITLKSPPYFSTNRRGYLLTESLKVGQKVKVPYFDPISLTAQNTIVQYKGKEKVLIQRRVKSLHHFVESFSGVRVSSWINDKGEVVKEESPAGFVFIAEPEFKATDVAAAGSEILSTVSVPVQGVLPDLNTVESLQFRLVLPEEGTFDLNKDRQQYADQILTVSREEIPPANALPCQGFDELLASSPYVQADNPAITETLAEIIAPEDSAMHKVEKISTWLFDNLDKRPVIGVPDALTTLNSLKGDCNEHAALFAAMARNAGIPTRLAAGVTYHQEAFYYHAWNEVCIGGQWLSLDTTKNQIPADISHLKFVEGEIGEQVRIGALIGKLKIEVLQ